MKKFWLIFILGLGCPVFGQEKDFRFTYGSIKALIPSSSDSNFYIHEISTLINLSNSQTNVELVFLDRNNTENIFFIELSAPQRQDFLQAITQYKDWNDKAIKGKYKIEKIITNIRTTSVFWRENNTDEGFFSYKVVFDLGILSQNPKNHQLVLSLPFIQSKSGVVITETPSIHIEYNEVLKLEKLLSEKTVSDAVIKGKQKR